jgi:hypothetical protein
VTGDNYQLGEPPKTNNLPQKDAAVYEASLVNSTIRNGVRQCCSLFGHRTLQFCLRSKGSPCRQTSVSYNSKPCRWLCWRVQIGSRGLLLRFHEQQCGACVEPNGWAYQPYLYEDYGYADGNLESLPHITVCARKVNGQRSPPRTKNPGVTPAPQARSAANIGWLMMMTRHNSLLRMPSIVSPSVQKLSRRPFVSLQL